MADHRTVTAAAAALHLTPSAVSQQLAALEQETGHRLVERGAKGVRLTPAGEILLGHTNAVLAQLERAEAELAAYSSGEAGTVTVASFATGMALVVAPAVARLAAKVPGIRLRVQDEDGALEVAAENTEHHLDAGDCLRLRVWGPTRFRCAGPEDARYALAVVLP